MGWVNGSFSNKHHHAHNGAPATIATQAVPGPETTGEPVQNGVAGSGENGNAGVTSAIAQHEDIVIELDSDVVWSWYALSSSLKQREFSMREMSKSTARLVWAIAIHAISATMLWAVFENSGTSSLAGGRVLSDVTTFDVYLDECKNVDVAGVEKFLDDQAVPFWNMDDRLWLVSGTSDVIFGDYNSGQPNDNKLVSDLCNTEFCMPTSIIAVNGETGNATRMQEIAFSFLYAFCDGRRRSARHRRTTPIPKNGNREHYSDSGEQSWEQLTNDQRRYWTFLGWDPESFEDQNPLLCRNSANGPCKPQPVTLTTPNNVTVSNPEFVSWDDLSDNEQFAATELGWSKSMWDAGLFPFSFLKVTCQNALERVEIFAFVQVCAFTVMSLACVSEYRNFVMAAMFTFGIEKRPLMRVTLLLVAMVGYLLVPIFVQCASALVIFEAGTELDVLMDSLALLFILEMNNYFQFAHNPASATWQMALPAETYLYIDKVRDWFGRVASLSIIAFTIPLGSTFTLWPSTRIHPVWIFNPYKAPGPAAGFMAGMCIALAVVVAILLKVCGRYKAIVEAANNEDANENLVLPADRAELE